MPNAYNSDVRLSYREFGEGTPVVLLMGLRLPGIVWREHAEVLAERGCRVVVPDNRGTGGSDAPLPPYGMSTFADDVDAVMEAAGMDSALVAGVSFGGMVAQHLALRHSERVDGLVLISTTCGFPTGRLPPLPSIWLLLKHNFAPESTDLEAVRGLLAHSDSRETFDEFVEIVEEYLTESPTPLSGTIGQLTAVAAHHTGGELDDISVPTRVMTGDSDALVPPENSEILADAIPGATLRVVPRAGHIVLHERPEAFHEEFEMLRERCAAASERVDVGP